MMTPLFAPALPPYHRERTIHSKCCALFGAHTEYGKDEVDYDGLYKNAGTGL